MESFLPEEPDAVMNEINMIPFIDVMLVLLIVFIITVPVLKNNIAVELPNANSAREEVTPKTLQLAVAADGTYSLDGQPVSAAELESRLAAAAAQTPPPELHISGDRAVPYERVAQALAAAQQAGLSQIGFVTLPAAGAKVQP